MAQLRLLRISTPFCIGVMFIIVHIILVQSVQPVDSRYEACKPRSCGTGPNISYPFQTIGENFPDFCGYPGFELSCKENKPIYRTSRSEYIVEFIFYQNQSIKLVNAEVFNATCIAPQHFFAFDRSSFKFGPNYVDVCLFYNCTSSFPGEYKQHPISCASKAPYHSYAVIDDGKNEINPSAMPCQSFVAAPVDLEGGKTNPSIENVDYSKLLENGFTLTWSGNSCEECETSGGHCGFEGNEAVCFCLDQPHNKNCSDGKNHLKLILAIVIPGCASIFIVLALYLIWRRKKGINAGSYFLSRNTSEPSSKPDLEGGSVYFGVPVFSYCELEEATNNFDVSKELGDGGFGTVYFGKLRDGREVAVKRLYEHNFKRMEQFMNEIQILTRLRHPNLVTLYGCTSRRSRELLLVYEYIPNGTVADHLHGDRAKDKYLTWPHRMNIAIETADALAYLHKSDIIHRDVKTNNILIDNNFCVKVADFGLSRLFPTDVTHISTAPQGTPGYVDPEYHQCYQLTDRSDVYSFGVVLIELISSMPAVDISRHRHEINLANLAINRIQRCAFDELIDPSLGYKSDSEVMRMTTSVAELAFRCLQLEKDMRPKMDEVLETLKEIQNCKEILVDKTNEISEKAIESRGAMAPLSPESDEQRLLFKNVKLPSSPNSVADVWVSSSSTASTST